MDNTRDTDTDDQPLASDIGAIRAATVGGGNAILYGEYGVSRITLARVEVEIEHSAPASAVGRIVNFGAYRDDEDEEARMEFADYERLMRPGNRDMSRVNEHGQSIPPGGGSSATGKAKPLKMVITQALPQGMETPSTRFRVTGLTPGEAEVYHRRTGEARSVLRQQVGCIVRAQLHGTELAEPTPPLITVARRVDLVVYGLEDYELDILRNHRGMARSVLAAHARKLAPRTVQRFDGETMT